MISLLISLSEVGNAASIDFEGLSDGQLVTSEYAGITYGNATVAQAGLSLNEFEFPPNSGVNVVYDSAGPISISFESPVNFFSAFFTYQVPLEIVVYETGHHMLGSVSSAFSSNLALSGDAGSSPNERLSIFQQNISQIEVLGSPSGMSFVMDDVSFGSTTPIPTPIPLPGTHLLVVVALLALHLSLGKQRATPFTPRRVHYLLRQNGCDKKVNY
jgi:hypothetical protein